MSAVGQSFCLFLNKFFPKPHLKGRKSPDEYSEMEYQWAEDALRMHGPYLNFENAALLDAGCGLGGRTVWYAEQGCALCAGIDIDARHVAAARAFAEKKEAANTEFFQGSLANLPFDDDSFDLVFLNDVIEHLERHLLIEALTECKRVLRPGAMLCAEFPPWTSPDASHLYDRISIPWCQLLFSQETLIRVVESMEIPQRHGNLSYVEHFRQLNRITIGEFRELVEKLQFKVINWDYRMVHGRRKLRMIPYFNRFLTKRVVVVLSK